MIEILEIAAAVAFIVTAVETYVTPLGAWKAPAALLLAVVGLVVVGGLSISLVLLLSLSASYLALLLVALGQWLAMPRVVEKRRPARDWLPPLR